MTYYFSAKGCDLNILFFNNIIRLYKKLYQPRVFFGIIYKIN